MKRFVIIALLIAALAYNRQVNDGLRKQATLVKMTFEDRNQFATTRINVVNGSDQAVRIVKYEMAPNDVHVVNNKLPADLLSGDYLTIAQIERQDVEHSPWRYRYSWVEFNDARDGDGGETRVAC